MKNWPDEEKAIGCAVLASALALFCISLVIISFAL